MYIYTQIYRIMGNVNMFLRIQKHKTNVSYFSNRLTMCLLINRKILTAVLIRYKLGSAYTLRARRYPRHFWLTPVLRRRERDPSLRPFRARPLAFSKKKAGNARSESSRELITNKYCPCLRLKKRSFVSTYSTGMKVFFRYLSGERTKYA